MKTLLKTSLFIPLFYILALFTACEDDDTVLPSIKAEFTYTVNIDTGTVTFINITENANTYEWSFGDGTTSTLINPVKTYKNGTYTVVLKAKNVAGALDSYEDEIIILIPETATVPISFDGENTKYEATTFGGASFAVVDNPDASGANASVSKVGEITNSGAQFEGFYFDLGSPLDLSTLKTVKVLFWSDKVINVLLKLENGTGADVETTAIHGGTGWEEIYFTFDTSASYSRFTMFVDGPGTTSGKFYIDDISQIDTANIPCTLSNLEIPMDFDCSGIDYASKIVGNVSFEVVDNPELSGINSEASKVGKIVNTGQNWENAFFNLDVPVDFSANNAIQFKLFSNQALPIKLKFEDGTEAPVEVDVNHTGSGWEMLTFNFASTASYNDMVLFVDGPGTATGTFYIDDIEQVTGVSCEQETMQSLSGADFNLTFQTDPTASIQSFDAGLSWVDNPDFTNELNKSCKVGRIDRNGAALFANNQIVVDSKFDFSANSGFKMKVWSPNAGTNVLVKLEDQSASNINTEVGAVTTKAADWEELTFPFGAGESGKYDRIILFFELNTNTTETYYIDDFALYSDGSGGGGTGDAVILNFENNLAGVTTGEFETGGALVANPSSSGINTSANVYEASYNNGNQWWGGVGFVFNNGLDQSITVYKAKFYSTVAPTNVLFQVEVDGTNAPVGEVQQITTANQWVELTFTLTNIPSGANRILIRPDVGDQTGTKPNTGSLYIDDITKANTGGGGSGGGGGGTGDNLASNGDFETGADSGWLRFQNGGTAVLDNALNNGGSWSGKLVVTDAGGNPAFKQEQIGVGTVSAGQNITVSFDYSGAVSQPGAVVNVILFGEGSSGASFTQVLSPGPSPTASWQSFTGSYTIPAGTDVSQGISFLIETVCGAVSGCGVTMNIDNVIVTAN